MLLVTDFLLLKMGGHIKVAGS